MSIGLFDVLDCESSGWHQRPLSPSKSNLHSRRLPQERAVTMKSLGDAIALRNRLIEHLEEADTECASSDREPLLTFVVAGGVLQGLRRLAVSMTS